MVLSCSVVRAQDRLPLEGLGLSVRLPDGAEASTREVAGKSATAILLPNELGYVIVQVARSGPGDLTTRDAEARLLERLLGEPGGDDPARYRADVPVRTTRGELLGASEPIEIGEAPDGRALTLRPFYLVLAARDADDPSARGYALLGRTAGEFIAFELFARPERLEPARAVFESILASVDISQAAGFSDERERRIAAGVAALAAIGNAGVGATIDGFEERWERYYRPGARRGDDQEIGYRRVRAHRGRRGEVGDSPPERWTASEQQPGYVVTIDARFLLDGGGTLDTRAAYFLSEDRESEFWTIRNGLRRRGDDRPASWTEIGTRDGRSMRVSIRRGRAAPQVIQPVFETAGYLSRVEAILLPELLLASGRPGEFAFYTYDHNAEKVLYREDDLTRSDGSQTLWTLTTSRAEAEIQRAVYDDEGRLLRVELGDGVRIEPVNARELLGLWQRKGLPTD